MHRLCFRKIHSNERLLLLRDSDTRQVLPTLSSIEGMQSNTLGEDQSIDYSDKRLPCGSHEVNKKLCKSANISLDPKIIDMRPKP